MYFIGIILLVSGTELCIDIEDYGSVYCKSMLVFDVPISPASFVIIK
jgi:hypothetical protein